MPKRDRPWELEKRSFKSKSDKELGLNCIHSALWKEGFKIKDLGHLAEGTAKQQCIKGLPEVTGEERGTLEGQLNRKTGKSLLGYGKNR